MKTKFSSTVAGASIFITLTLLIGRGLGLFREIVFANYFGLSSEYDQYLVASVLPITINSVVIYLAQNYFIPGFNLRIKKSFADAKLFTNHSFWIFVVGGIVIGSVLLLLSEVLLGIYVGSESINPESVFLFRIISFSIPIFAGSSILAAYLQANYKFRSPAISQLLMNISIIVIVLIFQQKAGVVTIAYGYLIGSVLQLAILFFISQKNERIINFSLKGGSSSFNAVKFSLIIILMVELFGQIYSLADRFFFSEVEQGGIAALNYAFNIYLLPISILSLAISTAIFPSLANTAKHNSESFENQINSFFTINIFLFVPITIILFAFGDVLITLLFERGRFSSQDSILTFQALKIYSYSIIFYSTYAVINKIFYSKNLLRQLLFISFLGIFLKITLNFLLVELFSYKGLALGSTISLSTVFLVSYFYLNYKKIILSKSSFWNELIISMANGITAYIASVTILNLMNLKIRLLNEILVIVFFIMLYVFNSYILKLKAYNIFINVLRTMLNKPANNVLN